MFYPVKILNSKGKMLKVLSSEALANRHWKLFADRIKPSFVKPKNLHKLREDKSQGASNDRFGNYFSLENFSLGEY